jgi:hypothetical protein
MKQSNNTIIAGSQVLTARVSVWSDDLTYKGQNGRRYHRKISNRVWMSETIKTVRTTDGCSAETISAASGRRRRRPESLGRRNFSANLEILTFSNRKKSGSGEVRVGWSGDGTIQTSPGTSWMSPSERTTKEREFNFVWQTVFECQWNSIIGLVAVLIPESVYQVSLRCDGN